MNCCVKAFTHRITLLDSCSRKNSGEATLIVKSWAAERQLPIATNLDSPDACQLDSSTSAEPAVPSSYGGIKSSKAVSQQQSALHPLLRLKQQQQQRRPPAHSAATQTERASNASEKEKISIRITGMDPYTTKAYEQRTGMPCHAVSFQDIIENGIPSFPLSEKEPTNDDVKYDLVIVSYALHLLSSDDQLYALLHTLSRSCKWLVIISPHKKPALKSTWGWQRWNIDRWAATEEDVFMDGSGQSLGHEILIDKVHLRLWRSNNTEAS